MDRATDVTLVPLERIAGEPGPPPLDEHTEIRWACVDGDDVVIKAVGHPHRSELRREAEILQRIAMDDAGARSVVAFVELTEGADHTELVTRRHGTVTLAEAGLLSYPERTAALLSLCEAVDLLHRSGWTHGSIEARHALVDTGVPHVPGHQEPHPASVRLCSLSGAEQLRSTGAEVARAGDRQALATVVLEVLDAPGGFGSGRERRRHRASVRKARKRLMAARGLHDPATVAGILRESMGPNRAGFGRSKERSLHRGSLPTPRDGAHPGVVRRTRSRGSASPRWRSWVVVLGAALCAVAGAAAAHALEDTATEAAGVCELDIAGSTHECSDATIDGNVVTIGDTRFALGSAGDSVLIGDWNCDRKGTAVLLQSASGALFHFERWSTDTEEVTGTQIGNFADATGLRRGADCRYPEVELADGSTITPLEQHESGAAQTLEHTDPGP